MIDSFVLVIGAIKSGTTSLFQYLSEHPEIAPARTKEPNFFADNENWERGMKWYEDLWDWSPESHQIALEASTDYTKLPAYPNAARRIAQIDRRFKFIYLIRDPIDRIESHLTHGLIAGWRNERKTIEKMPHLINTSRYYSQIKEYTSRFSSKNIKIVKLKDMNENTDVVMEEIFNFLGVKSKVEVDLGRRIYNRTEDKEPYREHWLFRKSLQIPWVASMVRHAPKTLKTLSQSILQDRVERQHLSADERAYALFNLEADMEKLEQDFDLDLSDWSRRSYA